MIEYDETMLGLCFDVGQNSLSAVNAESGHNKVAL